MRPAQEGGEDNSSLDTFRNRACGSQPAAGGKDTSGSPFPLHTLLCVSLVELQRGVPSGPYLAQLQVGQRAGINEGLGDHRETGVDVVGLVDVKDKLGVLQDVDPKPQG